MPEQLKVPLLLQMLPKAQADVLKLRYAEGLTDYKRIVENLTVLSLLVQRAVTDHLWVNAPRKDAIQFGQRPGPTARAAGRLATRLVAPRVVAATWWEHLLFLCAAWVCAVLAFCYVSGTALSICLLYTSPSPRDRG